MKADVYECVTALIIADLKKGVRPWLKPWNAEQAAGRITQPLRANRPKKRSGIHSQNGSDIQIPRTSTEIALLGYHRASPDTTERRAWP